MIFGQLLITKLFRSGPNRMNLIQHLMASVMFATNFTEQVRGEVGAPFKAGANLDLIVGGALNSKSAT